MYICEDSTRVGYRVYDSVATAKKALREDIREKFYSTYSKSERRGYRFDVRNFVSRNGMRGDTKNLFSTRFAYQIESL